MVVPWCNLITVRKRWVLRSRHVVISRRCLCVKIDAACLGSCLLSMLSSSPVLCWASCRLWLSGLRALVVARCFKSSVLKRLVHADLEVHDASCKWKSLSRSWIVCQVDVLQPVRLRVCWLTPWSRLDFCVRPDRPFCVCRGQSPPISGRSTLLCTDSLLCLSDSMNYWGSRWFS